MCRNLAGLHRSFMISCEVYCTRVEVVRHHVEDYNANGGVMDMLNDYHEAQLAEGHAEDEQEVTAKAFYDMFDAVQKSLHGKAQVFQLDVIEHVMAFKSQYDMSRNTFDVLLTVIGRLLPEDHVLPKSMYEAQKLLHALKITYEQIHACLKGCVLFRKEYTKAKYCSKCKSSRFMEVDSGDGQKRQLDIPVTILHHRPFISRIHRLYMIRPNGERYVTLDVVAAFSYYMFKFIIETNTFSLLFGQILEGCGECRGHGRNPNGILGLLCREHFLGLVEYAGVTGPAYTFDHYAVAPDAVDRDDKEFNNKAE
jgi:hypothetical protein